MDLYRRAASLRKEESFQNSDITFLEVNGNLLSFTRGGGATSSDEYLVLANLGQEASSFSLSNKDISQAQILLTNVGLQTNSVELSHSLVVEPGKFYVLKISRITQALKTEF